MFNVKEMTQHIPLIVKKNKGIKWNIKLLLRKIYEIFVPLFMLLKFWKCS